MPDLKRTVKIITEQKVIPNADSGVPGFPLRHWSISIYLQHAENKTDVPADIFNEVTYMLHESFGDKAKQVKKSHPFRVAEDGWGEFEMQILLTDAGGKTHTIIHDLNFQQAKYEVKHVIMFRNPKAGSDLFNRLRNSGPVPGDTNGDAAGGKKRASEIGAGGTGLPKKKKGGDGKSVDMDKLAEGLQKLGEDDLLQVVQMVHDNKSEESWMRNDVEQGEFHVDLYTLPESLINMLWTFSKEKGVLSEVAA
ncbi:uncharacterized protein HMPREF1541_09970 [Cyphellophora europaea CBS 101466]|uniref:YEATS domain-containing protein n=1 Tax=Cyphellophora europaea (strain CBS 101466) TaxID=1220924 RepID=W2SAZ6_CYPE1|nr:uncharacterized protein HMPREF1541_09970 [Cyphellophora europaea CBS 101466]ETN45094.1 hypothetical protein HMPREF1541_09970 [Cyphellophora europaea CBS 101466]